jgi:hypothetical protein
MMDAMNTPNTTKYNTALDEEIMSLGGAPDGEGEFHDIHETLFHSKKEGFYLQRKIRQALRGRTWDTLELGEYDYMTSTEEVRFLTVYRTMSREQVMRFLIEAYMPVAEGIRAELLGKLIPATGTGSQDEASETASETARTTNDLENYA